MVLGGIKSASSKRRRGLRPSCTRVQQQHQRSCRAMYVVTFEHFRSYFTAQVVHLAWLLIWNVSGRTCRFAVKTHADMLSLSRLLQTAMLVP